MTKPHIISIIGGRGKMGSIFAKTFRKNGNQVVVADNSSKIPPKKAASIGDIIIVSVPIRDTVEVVKDIGPYIKKEAIFTDFTSIKTEPTKAMTEHSKAYVIGGHPLFGPTVDFKGQTFVLCKTGKLPNLARWYVDFLKKLGLNVVFLTPKEHDENMAVIQGLNHISSIAISNALKSLDYDIDLGEKIASPSYLMTLYGVARIVNQDETLYSDVDVLNPFSENVIKKLKESTDELYETVKNKDQNQFEEIFISSKKYFGDFCQKAMRATDRMIKAMTKNN